MCIDLKKESKVMILRRKHTINRYLMFSVELSMTTQQRSPQGGELNEFRIDFNLLYWSPLSSLLLWMSESGLVTGNFCKTFQICIVHLDTDNCANTTSKPVLWQLAKNGILPLLRSCSKIDIALRHQIQVNHHSRCSGKNFQTSIYVEVHHMNS